MAAGRLVATGAHQELQADEDRLKGMIAHRLGDAAEGQRDGELVVHLAEVARHDIDRKRLQAPAPRIAQECTARARVRPASPRRPDGEEAMSSEPIPIRPARTRPPGAALVRRVREGAQAQRAEARPALSLCVTTRSQVRAAAEPGRPAPRTPRHSRRRRHREQTCTAYSRHSRRRRHREQTCRASTVASHAPGRTARRRAPYTPHYGARAHACRGERSTRRQSRRGARRARARTRRYVSACSKGPVGLRLGRFFACRSQPGLKAQLHLKVLRPGVEEWWDATQQSRWTGRR